MPDATYPKPGRCIAVVGTSGAGKTYIAKRLAEVLGLTYICSDAILWGPDWTWRSDDEQLADYDRATRAPGWTFDGNLGSATKTKSATVLDRIDTLVWLDLPRSAVFRQVLVRTIRRAWTKEPLWAGNRESWRMSFFSRESILLWSMQTYALRRRQYTELFNSPAYSHVKRIRISSRREVDAWLKALEGGATSRGAS